MDRLDGMAAFAAAVETGSLSGAARRLGCSLASISRQISAIERQFGVRLLARTTRRLALTDEGREYYEHVKRIVSEVVDAERTLSAQAKVPQGRLRVSAPTLIGRLWLAPLLSQYLAEFPQVSIDLTLMDRVPNLLEDEIDIAVVLGSLPDSSLIRRHLGNVRRVICASPGYLRARGTPVTPADLAKHDCLLFTTTHVSSIWTFQIAGKRTEVDVPARLRSNALDVVVSAALGGAGITRAPSWQVQDHLDEGRLELVLQDYERPSMSLQILFSGPRHPSRKVQSFAEFLSRQWRVKE
ncbi:MAG: transcriptional regulator, LysR family [Tardiphaga sp.]|nr:transcriptional regulator, LysR family [Tardiphaga sp.]